MHGHHHTHSTHSSDDASKLSLAHSATWHCLMGCGLGEVLGVIIGTALGLSNINTLVAAANGRVPEIRQSVRMIGPVSRAMGHVQDVMVRAGPQAVRDLWLAGFPMALAGRVATLFSSLSPDQRGIAAVLTTAIVTLTTIGIAIAWVL
jgi:hypothetical protein